MASLYNKRHDFNPLSPHGERPNVLKHTDRPTRFQSTLPAWGETAKAAEMTDREAISIHSPRMGRDIPFERG